MKKSIRFSAAVLSVCMLLALLTACKKSPSDSAAFKKLAGEFGYKTYDVTSQYANAPQIREVTIAAPSGREFQIEFYLVTDLENAKKLYLAQCEVVAGYQGSDAAEKTSNGQNYAQRSVVTNGKYLMVAYIENTLVYVPPTDKQNKDQIEKFLDRFKY